MLALLSAYGAGLLTTVNPCVLPVLPIVVATAFSGGRFGPLALVLGLATGFATIGVTVAATGAFLGLTPEMLRIIAASLFIAAGLVFLVPRLADGFTALMQPLAARADAVTQRANGASLFGQFGVGLLLGAVWSPCSGPALGAAIGLAATAEGLPQAALRMAVFGLGAGTMLALIAYGSRAAFTANRASLMRMASAIKPVAGALFVAIGLMTLTGYDKRLEAAVTGIMPMWLIDLTTSI
jgi:cytochrome c biogenesis protein CcdA